MSYFNEQKHVLSGAEVANAQALQTQIDRTDKEIDRMVYALYVQAWQAQVDRMVYALYGLSEEEVVDDTQTHVRRCISCSLRITDV